MTTERETLRIIGSWMEEGRTRLPDHVLDVVLDQLPATPQRRPTWQAWRITHVNALTKYAIGAAAVVVLAIAGFNLIRPSDRGSAGVLPPASVGPFPSPSAASSSSAVPILPSRGAIAAGRYRWTSPRGDVTFAVGDGWTGRYEEFMTAMSEFPAASPSGSAYYGAMPGPTEIGFSHNLPGTGVEVTHIYADACRSAGKLEPIGATVGDLVAALDSQASTDVVVTQLAAGSLVGRRVAVTQAAGVDRSKCRHGASGPLQIWANETETDYFAFAPGHHGAVYAFDVDGTRFVFGAYFGPETTQADIAEVDALVESFEFSTP